MNNIEHMREALIAAAERLNHYVELHKSIGQTEVSKIDSAIAKRCTDAAVRPPETISSQPIEACQPRESDRDLVLRMLARSARMERYTIGGKAYWAAVERIWGIEPTVALQPPVKSTRID